MDLVKIAGIKDWKTPEKVKDICSFLGFCNFYCTFIKGFSSIAWPLNTLTKKDQMWKWTKEHQKAFELLKARVTSEPILAHPELDKQFELEVNASGFAIEAVLLQKKEDKKRHPVGYYLVTFNTAEQNHDIYDLELPAIIKASGTGGCYWLGCHTRSKSSQTTWTSNIGTIPKRSVAAWQGKY